MVRFEAKGQIESEISLLSSVEFVKCATDRPDVKRAVVRETENYSQRHLISS
jgi:hypothetical protein